MIHQRISGNACLRLVSFREPAVNHQQLAVCLDGFLALDGLHRYVAVDDMRMRPRDAKLRQNVVTDVCPVTQ